MLWGLVPLFVIAHTGHHIVSALLTPLLPFIRNDFSLGYTQIGFLLSAYSLAYGFSQLPAGWLADRIGPRIVLTCGVSGVALAGVIAGLSPHYFILASALVLMGIMGGGYHPAASPLVSAAVEPAMRGRALGFHQVGGAMSFFLAPVIAAALAAALGWRGTFLATSIPTFVFGVVFHVLLGRLNPDGSSGKGTGKTSDSTEGADPGVKPRLIAVVACGTLVMVFLFSIISFIPLYLVDNFGVSEKVAAAMLALCLSGGLWAGPLAGFAADRLGRETPVIVATGLIGGPAIYLMNTVSYGWILWLFLILIGMAQNLSLPMVESYIIRHTPPEKRSTTLGVYYFGSRGGSGVVAPAIGFMVDRLGFRTSFAAVALTIVIISVLFGFYMRRPQR